ncbi:MAG: ABC transporter ATP-binding protein [Desulfobacterales bacterium]|nr:MAG: ABC transporter ATP-binding protein [Desulfobacterales bacterium]
MQIVVKTSEVGKVYHLGKTRIRALDHIDLEIESGEFIAIAGPSGSGKTTLLNLIGCLDRPTTGRIEIAGRDVSDLSGDQLADIRNKKIGFIFQTFNLIPVLTAYENIEFPLLLGDNIPAGLRKSKIMQVLEEVGLREHANHRPEELSGGQRQRVAIARALVKDPDIILADEPTANLDSATGENIVKLMLKLNREKGKTFIFSTHDRMIIQYAARVVRLHDGKMQPDASDEVAGGQGG